MFDEARLARLIDAYLDQELTATEKPELESMLLSSSRARQIFIERAEWHGLTREWALQSQTGQLMGNPSAFQDAAPLSVWKTGVPFPMKAGVLAAIAACLAILAVVLMKSSMDPRPDSFAGQPPEAPAHENVALLAQAIDVEWEEGEEGHAVGSALPKGSLKIRRGTIRLDFYSGARVFLEGPATLDLLSPDLARLEQGKLTANVPPPAQGFTILNANLRVVDRGTEFGMSVNGPDDTEVHVFDGEVELQGDVPAAGQRALFEGNAASIRKGRWVSFAANRRSFADPAAMLQAAARETEARWESWRTRSRSFSRSPDLLVHFDFEEIEHGDMILQNRALGAPRNSHGTVIGCDILSGRWARKSALGFASTSDRVRFRMEGTTPSITLMAWVRVDSLPQDHNALLSMAPEMVGELHWKLNKAGRVLVGIRAEPEFAFESWERLESPQIVSARDFGRWIHLATVIDGENGFMKHFHNGEEVASGPLKRRPLIQLGMANLGNLDALAGDRHTFGAVHSFTGRMDEFALFRRALTASEIQQLK